MGNKKNSSKKKQEVAGENRNVEKGANSQTHVNFALYFLFFLLIVVVYFCYQIIQPYIHTIIMAAILAITLSPINRFILRKVKGRQNLAAILSCLFLTLVVIIPILFMLIAVIQQGIGSFNAISDWVKQEEYRKLTENDYVSQVLIWGENKLPDLQRLFPDLDLKKIKFNQILLDGSAIVGSFLMNQGGHIVGNITALIGKFFLMIFAFFYIIRDEEKIFSNILHYSPLSASHEEQIIIKVRAVAKSALIGTLITAVAQGAAGGIAFWICDLPGLFWGMIMAFASLIPIVGTALIWIPAALYLLITGHWGLAIFMVAWCAIIVGMIDNLVRPLFMKGSAGMSTLLIFFSIIGGIGYFGLLGVLYGPLLFGLAMVLFYIYSLEMNDFLDSQDKR